MSPFRTRARSLRASAEVPRCAMLLLYFVILFCLFALTAVTVCSLCGCGFVLLLRTTPDPCQRPGSGFFHSENPQNAGRGGFAAFSLVATMGLGLGFSIHNIFSVLPPVLRRIFDRLSSGISALLTRLLACRVLNGAQDGLVCLYCSCFFFVPKVKPSS